MYKFVFLDLYGTLLDIHTDEASPEPWEALYAYLLPYSERYLGSGAGTEDSGAAIHSPENLRQRFMAREQRETELALAGTGNGSLPGGAVPADGAAGHPEAALRDGKDASQVEIDIAEVYTGIFSDMGISAETVSGEHLLVRAPTVFREASRQWIRIFPGAADFLTALRKKGLTTVLASNAQELYTDKELEGLKPFLDRVFLSSRIGYKKPSPAFFEHILQCTGAAPAETVMIGNDSVCDIRGAAGVGIDGIYLDTGGTGGPGNADSTAGAADTAGTAGTDNGTCRSSAQEPQAVLSVHGADYQAVYDFIAGRSL